jgi:hypothetical protein
MFHVSDSIYVTIFTFWSRSGKNMNIRSCQTAAALPAGSSGVSQKSAIMPLTGLKAAAEAV